jgi:DNA-binding transcriptional LysR family regulator
MNELFSGMEYVYAVYQEKSFSAAAKKLFISQPSLSASVRRVEERVGYPIFDRSTKPLSLTDCGRRYIRSAEQIMAIQSDFFNYLNDWGELKTGTLMLGGSSLYSSQVLPAIIRRFSEKYPGVQVGLIEGNSEKLHAMLQEGTLDVIMDNFTLDPHIYDRLIYKSERLFLAVPKQFEINRRMGHYSIPAEDIAQGPDAWKNYCAVPLTAFSGEPFIFLKPENDTGKRARMFCSNAGFVPKVLFEMDQQMTSYQISRSGLGICFLSDTLISCVMDEDRLLYYPLDAVSSQRNLCLYRKHGHYAGRAIEEFFRIAKTFRP